MKESSTLNIQKQNKTEELDNCRIESGKNKMNIKTYFFPPFLISLLFFVPLSSTTSTGISSTTGSG